MTSENVPPAPPAHDDRRAQQIAAGAATDLEAGEPRDRGICGDSSLPVLGTVHVVCDLLAGHPGWHEANSGTRWSPPTADIDAPDGRVDRAVKAAEIIDEAAGKIVRALAILGAIEVVDKAGELRDQLDQAEAAGYARAVTALRDDERYRTWDLQADPNRWQSPATRAGLADYLEAVGPATVPGGVTVPAELLGDTQPQPHDVIHDQAARAGLDQLDAADGMTLAQVMDGARGREAGDG